MNPFSFSIRQSDPPLPPAQVLPTMYDLPSEDPEEPGLPDEFHDLQHLLSSGMPIAQVSLVTVCQVFF